MSVRRPTPPSEPSRVFISYARKDGAPLAQRLQKDLKEQGFNAWLDTQRILGGATWTTDIEHALDDAEFVVALMTSGSYVSEICRAEQLRALRKDKCVIPVKVQPGADVPLHLEAKNYRDFTTKSSYGKAFKQLLADLHARNGIALKPEFRATSYITVPPLPVNFVERPGALAALRDSLITDEGGRHIALTALQGMGGIGKTVLAQALCHDEVVQQAFPDGVVWITIGNESSFDPLTRMREVGKALGDKPSRYNNLLAAKNQYRSTIRKKAALIVVDDVWRSSDLEPLRAEDSPRSRLLFTTRDASIAAAMGAREHDASLLSEEQSREVLARWSRTEITNLPPIAAELIKECDKLPLALSMVGAMLRRKPTAVWRTVLRDLRNADLQKIKAEFPDYPHPNLFRTIHVSVEKLEYTARERYIALAVLPEQVAATPQMQQRIWAVGLGEAVETAESFVGLSLAQRDQPEGSIRLHDLQLDYVRSRAGSNFRILHSRLLHNYKEEFCLHGWHTGPNDGYFFQHLVYHFTQAGQSSVEDGSETVEDILTNRKFIRTKLSNDLIFSSVADLKIVTRRRQILTKAIEALVKELPKNKSEGFWQKLRAALNRNFGPYRKWPETLRRSLATSGNFYALLFVAQTLSMEGRYDEGAKLYTSMLGLSLSPEQYSAAVVRLSVTYEERKQTTRALRILRKLVASRSARKRYGENFWWAQYQIGKNLLSKKQYDQAKRVLERVRRQSKEGSRRTAALHQLGVLDLEQGDFAQAERKFKECLKERGSGPTNHRRAFEHRRLGDVYALTGRPEDAENEFKKALDISESCGDRRYVKETKQDRARLLGGGLSEKTQTGNGHSA